MKKIIVFAVSGLLICQSAFTMEVTLNECMPRQIKSDSEKVETVERAIKAAGENIKTATEHLKDAVSARKKSLRCDLMNRAKKELETAKGNLHLVDYKLRTKKPRRTVDPYPYNGRYDKAFSSSIVEIPLAKQIDLNAKNIGALTKNCKKHSERTLKHYARVDLSRVSKLNTGYLKSGTEYSEVVKNLKSVNKDKVNSCDKLISNLETKPSDCRLPDFEDTGIDIDVVFDLPRELYDRKPAFFIETEEQRDFFGGRHVFPSRSIAK